MVTQSNIDYDENDRFKSDDKLADEAIDIIKEVQSLYAEARRITAIAMNKAKIVLQRTDAPFLYDKDANIVIYPKAPRDIRFGKPLITYHMTPGRYQETMIRLDATPSTYSAALAKYNELASRAELARLKAEAEAQGKRLMWSNEFKDYVLVEGNPADVLNVEKLTKKHTIIGNKYLPTDNPYGI